MKIRAPEFESWGFPQISYQSNPRGSYKNMIFYRKTTAVHTYTYSHTYIHHNRRRYLQGHPSENVPFL